MLATLALEFEQYHWNRNNKYSLRSPYNLIINIELVTPNARYARLALEFEI